MTIKVLRTPDFFMKNSIHIEGNGMDYIEYRSSFTKTQFKEIANMLLDGRDVHFLMAGGERVTFYELKKKESHDVIREDMDLTQGEESIE